MFEREIFLQQIESRNGKEMKEVFENRRCRAGVSNRVPWRAESKQVFLPTNHYTS